jgi:hypothetical protein
MTRRRSLFLGIAALLASAGLHAAQPVNSFPPAGEWARKAPAELGMDAAALAAAVQYAQGHETERAVDFSDQEATFGSRLGSMPTRRAHTNGVVIYKGYVVAEFGDTHFDDPTYSVAKSMLSTVAGVALRDGRGASGPAAEAEGGAVLLPAGRRVGASRAGPARHRCREAARGRRVRAGA